MIKYYVNILWWIYDVEKWFIVKYYDEFMCENDVMICCDDLYDDFMIMMYDDGIWWTGVWAPLAIIYI